MSITLKATKSFTTTDGKIFAVRDEALAHEKFLQRVDRLQEASFSVGNGPLQSLEDLENSRGDEFVAVPLDDLAIFIAANAEVIIEALTVKQARGPRKPKVGAELSGAAHPA